MFDSPRVQIKYKFIWIYKYKYIIYTFRQWNLLVNYQHVQGIKTATEFDLKSAPIRLDRFGSKMGNWSAITTNISRSSKIETRKICESRNGDDVEVVDQVDEEEEAEQLTVCKFVAITRIRIGL